MKTINRQGTTRYRLVVGEVGNEQGHVIQTSAYTEHGARVALGRKLAAYGDDGWGRVEVSYHGSDEWGWQRL